MESQSNYILGLHSNVVSGNLTGGHAWITITRKDNGFTQSFGLWPDGHPRTKNNGKGTDVRRGMEPATGAANRYYSLTITQHNKLIRLINTTEHWFYTNNCSSWASEITYKTLRVHIDANDYFGIETPRELGENIRMIELADPTSKKSPKSVIWRKTRRGLRRVI